MAWASSACRQLFHLPLFFGLGRSLPRDQPLTEHDECVDRVGWFCALGCGENRTREVMALLGKTLLTGAADHGVGAGCPCSLRPTPVLGLRDCDWEARPQKPNRLRFLLPRRLMLPSMLGRYRAMSFGPNAPISTAWCAVDLTEHGAHLALLTPASLKELIRVLSRLALAPCPGTIDQVGDLPSVSTGLLPLDALLNQPAHGIRQQLLAHPLVSRDLANGFRHPPPPPRRGPTAEHPW